MGCDGVVLLKDRLHNTGEEEEGDQHYDAQRDQNRKIEGGDSRGHSFIDAKEQKQGGGAEAGDDEAEAPKQTADKPSDEIRSDSQLQYVLEKVKDNGNCNKADNE